MMPPNAFSISTMHNDCPHQTIMLTSELTGIFTTQLLLCLDLVNTAQHGADSQATCIYKRPALGEDTEQWNAVTLQCLCELQPQGGRDHFLNFKANIPASPGRCRDTKGVHPPPYRSCPSAAGRSCLCCPVSLPASSILNKETVNK